MESFQKLWKYKIWGIKMCQEKIHINSENWHFSFSPGSYLLHTVPTISSRWKPFSITRLDVYFLLPHRLTLSSSHSPFIASYQTPAFLPLLLFHSILSSPLMTSSQKSGLGFSAHSPPSPPLNLPWIALKQGNCSLFLDPPVHYCPSKLLTALVTFNHYYRYWCCLITSLRS